MKNKTSTAGNAAISDMRLEAIQHGSPSAGTDPRQPIRQALRRHCTAALILAIAIGGPMILAGYRPMGKGLILGSIFSVINFILMATALPMRSGLGPGKTFVFSLGSIYFRYAVMAMPLIWALKRESVDVFAVAGGLFMVQVAILGDQLWTRMLNPLR